MSIRTNMLCLFSKQQQPMKRGVASCLTHPNFTQRVQPVNQGQLETRFTSDHYFSRDSMTYTCMMYLYKNLDQPSKFSFQIFCLVLQEIIYLMQRVFIVHVSEWHPFYVWVKYPNTLHVARGLFASLTTNTTDGMWCTLIKPVRLIFL